MIRQLAEMTSKWSLPQAFANYQSPKLGGDPSGARVNRGTPTAAHNKGQTSGQPIRQPSMKPCYDDRFHGSTPRGRVGRIGSLFECVDLFARTPGQTDTETARTDVRENYHIYHGTSVESL